MNTTTIAVDLAKNVFQVAISRHPGKVAEQRRLSRAQFLRFFAKRQPALVVMEACGGAHAWGREIEELGHQVRLLPPRHVSPYRRGNKTDQADTKTILEALRNEEIRPVPIRTVEQQTLAALHRIRSAWLADRTARLNLVRAILRELGFVIPVGARHVVPEAWGLLENADSPLPDPMRLALAELCLEIRELEERAAATEVQLRVLAQQIPLIRQLETIPGIGLLTATALVAFVGDVQRFPTARHFASFLGLTPREFSSGQSRSLGRISKRGNSYLRMMLIHGARAVLLGAKRLKAPDRLRSWALGLEKHRGHNKATVALANKAARIVWAVWRNGCSFESAAVAA